MTPTRVTNSQTDLVSHSVSEVDLESPTKSIPVNHQAHAHQPRFTQLESSSAESECDELVPVM